VTAEIRRLPEEGDVVIATIRQLTGHGAYVVLDEFNGMTGFLHISEIATGWIRNIERYVKPRQKAVFKVIRVNKTRAEVDLSLKQVSGEERKSKLIEVKKNEKASAFMDIIKEKTKINDVQVKEIEDKILQKYDYVYDFFEEVAKKGIATPSIDLSQDILKAIEEESNKIQIPQVEIRGIAEIAVRKPNGIEVIKSTLLPVETSKSATSTVSVTYIGAPRYRIVVEAENFKIAEKAMNNLVEKIHSNIDRHHGSFNFIREESKKTHLQR
jgi:translation initiation factor 2 subunit 1